MLWKASLASLTLHIWALPRVIVNTCAAVTIVAVVDVTQLWQEGLVV